MSDVARFWSRRLRGLNFAEHAVLRELAEYHNGQTGLCFPSHQTIAESYECSRVYLKQILYRLERWQLVSWVEQFDANGEQSSNLYRLHLERHFPFPAAKPRMTNKDKNTKQRPRPYDERDLAALAGAQAGQRLLRLTHSFLKNATLIGGLKEAFLEKSQTRKTAKSTKPDVLWIAIESQTHLNNFFQVLPDLAKHLRKETGFDFEVDKLELFHRKKGEI